MVLNKTTNTLNTDESVQKRQGFSDCWTSPFCWKSDKYVVPSTTRWLFLGPLEKFLEDLKKGRRHTKSSQLFWSRRQWWQWGRDPGLGAVSMASHWLQILQSHMVKDATPKTPGWMRINGELRQQQNKRENWGMPSDLPKDLWLNEKDFCWGRVWMNMVVYGTYTAIHTYRALCP